MYNRNLEPKEIASHLTWVFIILTIFVVSELHATSPIAVVTDTVHSVAPESTWRALQTEVVQMDDLTVSLIWASGTIAQTQFKFKDITQYPTISIDGVVVLTSKSDNSKRFGITHAYGTHGDPINLRGQLEAGNTLTVKHTGGTKTYSLKGFTKAFNSTKSR